MHPKVRDLYKQLLWAGKSYPGGLDVVRAPLKKSFQKNSHLNIESKEFNEAIAKGEYILKEIIALVQFKKYRTLKRNYEWGQDVIDKELRKLNQK